MAITAFRFGTAFSPLDYAPALWLDGSDASTMFDATSGGNLVSPNGLIARWEDKSGNGRHVTQSTTGLRPTRKDAQLNGKTVVDFSKDFMVNVNGLGSRTGLTVYNVYMFRSTFSGSAICCGEWNTGADPSSNEWLVNLVARRHVLVVIGSTFFDTGLITARNTKPFEIVGFVHDGSNFIGRLNGSEEIVPAPGVINQVTGRHFHVGSIYGNGDVNLQSEYSLDGQIAEIIVYPTALTPFQRQRVEAYLNRKYAIY